MRTSDRHYLHLEGFEIPANEPVELTLHRIEARRPLPRLAATGLAVATTALAIGFLAAPLRRSAAQERALAAAPSSAVEERASVMESIRSLDEDYEIGKIAEADYQEMRTTLRAEAVHLLRLEREAQDASATDGDAARRCPSCSAEISADARFCSQCGVRLSEDGSRGGAPPA